MAVARVSAAHLIPSYLEGTDWAGREVLGVRETDFALVAAGAPLNANALVIKVDFTVGNRRFSVLQNIVTMAGHPGLMAAFDDDTSEALGFPCYNRRWYRQF